MRETVAAFRARTGRAYLPGAAGRPLADDEPCPTLYRWPGAGALLDALAENLPLLGPPGAPTLWLCEDATVPAPGGAGRFGALAVLEPLGLGVVACGNGVYAAANLPVDPERTIWVPPRSTVSLDGIASAREAQQALGPRWLEERLLTMEGLSSYLEELSALASAGAPPLERPWCEIDPAEQARIRARYGL